MNQSSGILIGNGVKAGNGFIKSLEILIQGGVVFFHSFNQLIGLVSNTEFGLALRGYPGDVHFLIGQVVLLWDFVF